MFSYSKGNTLQTATLHSAWVTQCANRLLLTVVVQYDTLDAMRRVDIGRRKEPKSCCVFWAVYHYISSTASRAALLWVWLTHAYFVHDISVIHVPFMYVIQHFAVEHRNCARKHKMEWYFISIWNCHSSFLRSFTNCMQIGLAISQEVIYIWTDECQSALIFYLIMPIFLAPRLNKNLNPLQDFTPVWPHHKHTHRQRRQRPWQWRSFSWCTQCR